MMMLENNLRKCKYRAVDVTEVVQMSHAVKLLSNCGKYINKLKNMLSINQDTDNVNKSITFSCFDSYWQLTENSPWSI